MIEPVTVNFFFHLACLSDDQLNMSKDGARIGEVKSQPIHLASLHPVPMAGITNPSQNSFQLFLISCYRVSLWGCQELEDKMICLHVLDKNVLRLYHACVLHQEL